MNDIIQLLACPTCRVDPGSNINQATNGAVFVMLGAMALVFGGFLAVAVSFVRKQRAAGMAALAGVPAAGTDEPR